MPDKIVLQSAGSLSVAIIAFQMFLLQVFLSIKKKKKRWYAWSAAISFSALLYAAGVFGEYNTPAGAVNRFSGLLEYEALILLVHCMYGFMFSYMGIKAGKYHLWAGLFHAFISAVLWTTPFIVAYDYSTWHFLSLASPYVEPAIGKYGPLFIFYTAMSAIIGVLIWLNQRTFEVKYRTAFAAGMGVWIILGLHDALASLGIPSLQYFMEYGFLGFSLAALWVVVNSYMDTETDERYRVITEYAGESIIIAQDEKIVFGNPAFCELLGEPVSESSAALFAEMIKPSDIKIFEKLYHSALDGNTLNDRHTILIKRFDGDKRYLDIVISSITYRGRPAVLGIMRDITEQKREEEVLREIEEKLSRSKKMESLGLLAGGVAHDLNNVLSGIINYPELMLMELPKDSKLRKPLEGIKNGGLRAAAIVQDLLTVARGVAVQKEAINLNNLVLDYLDSPEFKKLQQFHPTVTISSNLDDRLSGMNASSIHISKVLMNLVSNASEAIAGIGKVTVTTRNCAVESPLMGYETVNPGDYVLLSVADNGPGISQEAIEKLFEPFYTKKVMGRSGTGLGLTVVWNIVKDHKGYIDVLSNKEGSTFRLYFPASEGDIKPRGLSMPLSEFNGNGETVVVVDDVGSQREISSRILSRLGYNPVLFSSGEDAVKYMQKNRAELMLIDMIMDPGINGRETYERILAIHPEQKAIIVSGFAETEDVKDAMSLGVKKFVKKPFSINEIAVAIKEVLSG